MYATPWHLGDGATTKDVPDYLELWRFEPHYRLPVGQLPRVLTCETLDLATLSFQRWEHAGCLTGARVWLFSLPSGQIIAGLRACLRTELT